MSIAQVTDTNAIQDPKKKKLSSYPSRCFFTYYYYFILLLLPVTVKLRRDTMYNIETMNIDDVLIKWFLML